MTTADCPECGGPVPVHLGVIQPHDMWLMRGNGMAQGDTPCPSVGAAIEVELGQPTAAHLALLAQVRDGRCYVSPRRVVKYRSGPGVDQRVLRDCKELGWLLVDDRELSVTPAGLEWLTRLT